MVFLEKLWFSRKEVKRALFKKTLMASYLAKCPNPCTNCLGWMPFSTSQWFLNPYSGHFFIRASLLQMVLYFPCSVRLWYNLPLPVCKPWQEICMGYLVGVARNHWDFHSFVQTNITWTTRGYHGQAWTLHCSPPLSKSELCLHCLVQKARVTSSDTD